MPDQDVARVQGEAALIKMRALAGDAHETTADVEECQTGISGRVQEIVRKAGHPSQDILDKALRTTISVQVAA